MDYSSKYSTMANIVLPAKSIAVLNSIPFGCVDDDDALFPGIDVDVDVVADDDGDCEVDTASLLFDNDEVTEEASTLLVPYSLLSPLSTLL